MIRHSILPRLAVVAAALLAGGCVGKIVGTTADVAIEVAKVPFKVGKAAVDVATDDDDEDETAAQ